MVRRLPNAVYRAIGVFGTSRFVRRFHPPVYRLTSGRGIVGRNFGVQNVIVTMTGRRSGRARSVALYAIPDGSRYVVIGSNMGRGQDPIWVDNLRADPHASLRVGRRVWPVVAEEADGPERDRLWTLATQAYPGYEVYQARTGRRIPVVVLAPIPTEQA